MPFPRVSCMQQLCRVDGLQEPVLSDCLEPSVSRWAQQHEFARHGHQAERQQMPEVVHSLYGSAAPATDGARAPTLPFQSPAMRQPPVAVQCSVLWLLYSDRRVASQGHVIREHQFREITRHSTGWVVVVIL